MPTCIICGFTDTNSIVHHINTAHKGGISNYQLFFSQPVVSETMFRNIENSMMGTGPFDAVIIADINASDRELIVDCRRRAKGPGTEILVTPDF